MLVLYILYGIIIGLFSITIHEAIHFFVAKAFHKKNIKIIISLKRISVEYDNDKKYYSIMIISIAPSILMFFAGILLMQQNHQNIYIMCIDIYLILNVLNLFPFFQDGKVALCCLVHLIKHKRKDNFHEK